MNILLCLLVAAAAQQSPGFPHPEYSLQCYPEMVMPGDTLYIKIVARNVYKTPIYIDDEFCPDLSGVQIRLKDTEGQEQKLLLEARVDSASFRFPFYVEVKPGKSHVAGILAINVPPLEDLKEPFWKRHLTKLPAIGKQVLLCVTVHSRSQTKDLSIDKIFGAGIDNCIIFFCCYAF